MPGPRSRPALPDDAAVVVRPMFGNVAAFHNGNMFAGLFGDDLFVRLPDDERGRLMEQGGSAFEPMPGRPMTDYVTVPPSWASDPAATRDRLLRSLEVVRTLPAREPGKARKRKS